jgi:alanine racemase
MPQFFETIARTLVRAFRKSRNSYRPLIEVHIDAAAIRHNLNVFKTAHGAVAPVLKSNAYGHGLIQVARILGPVPFLCVDSYFEALTLRTEGIRSAVLIMGYTPLSTIEASTLKDVAFAILSIDELRRAATHITRDVRVHLEIDTGMHRHGILTTDLAEAIALVRSNPFLIVEGAYSHFADADTPGSVLTTDQISSWNAAAAQLKAALPDIKILHCAATAGSAYEGQLDTTVMRLGIGLYGVNASTDELDLRPVLEMRARISSLRTLAAGEHVGYNATYTIERPTRVASVTAGYYEGVDRRLSGTGMISVRGISCPILGRVSMNITSIDVSNVPDVALDDEAVLISKDRQAPNSIESLARICSTIPYEIMVHIPAHLRRIVD